MSANSVSVFAQAASKQLSREQILLSHLSLYSFVLSAPCDTLPPECRAPHKTPLTEGCSYLEFCFPLNARAVTHPPGAPAFT